VAQKTLKMKKLAFFASALALVAVTACNNDSKTEEVKEEVQEVFEEATEEMEEAAEEVEETIEEVTEETEEVIEEDHSDHDHSEEEAH
jgi:hypothetical protein